ncbi:hypothetical protein [Streptomyces sp. NBC_01614]|uniref:hypothetical protein n=1 Tax=Streptomyces sp. NBC_01614 TaxID=2975897 RepID=UPI003862F400
MRADRRTATERAVRHTATARAFGKMRDVANTLRAVGEADAAFEQSDPAQAPPWMAYYDNAQYHGDTAHALFDLPSTRTRTRGKRPLLRDRGERPRLRLRRSRAISETKLASLVMAKGDDRGTRSCSVIERWTRW